MSGGGTTSLVDDGDVGDGVSGGLVAVGGVLVGDGVSVVVVLVTDG